MYLTDGVDPEFLEAPSVLYRWSKNLAERFSSAEKTIKVYSNETHYMLHSHPKVLDSLRKVHEKGVDICFVTGPVISASVRDGIRYSGLISLKNERVIRLYSRNRRGTRKSFVIIDDEIAFVEKECHPPLLSLLEHHEITMEANNAFYQYEFRALCDLFNSCLNNAKTNKKSSEQFILMTPSEIKWVVTSGANFDKLNKKELRKILRRIEEFNQKMKEHTLKIAEGL